VFLPSTGRKTNPCYPNKRPAQLVRGPEVKKAIDLMALIDVRIPS